MIYYFFNYNKKNGKSFRQWAPTWKKFTYAFRIIFFQGTILGMSLKSYLESGEEYFFGALAGIFLYISLSSLFPVLHDIIDDTEIIGEYDMDDNSQARFPSWK